MSDINHWLSLATYQAARGDKFPSGESLRWQIRQHRAELVQADALAQIAGRVHIHAHRADEVFITAGIRRAASVAADLRGAE